MTIIYVALFIAVAVVIGNIIYDNGLHRPVNWQRTVIMAVVAAVLVFAIEWAAEVGIDIGSQ